ncbi:AraC family transcriptional regulator, partial [Pedobacter sp. HMWF019]
THEIIDDFYQLISKHANQQRNVSFYAKKLSIKEISNELHFEETSVFCRYFKRIVGS